MCVKFAPRGTIKNSQEENVKSLTEEKVDHIHCTPLTYQANHFIANRNEVGQAFLPLVNPC